MTNTHILTVDFHNKASFINTNTNETEQDNDFYYMKRKNPLFWTFYVLKNGFESIEYPHATRFENEQLVKIECVEKLRVSKSKLKENNISNIKGYVEDDLLTAHYISLKTFTALCISYDIPIIIVMKNTCYIPKTQQSISGANVIDITFSSEKEMIVGINNHMLPEDEIKYNTYYHYNNINNPIKSIGSYKLPELIELFNQLHINDINCDKFKKIDYFNAIKYYIDSDKF